MEIINKKPPGKKLLKGMSLKTKWLLCAIGGLVLIGYGLCVFSEAGNLKHTKAPFTQWFLMGTYSLVVINAGISIFGQAIVFKSKMETKKMFKKMLKKRNKVQKIANLKPTIMKTE